MKVIGIDPSSKKIAISGYDNIANKFWYYAQPLGKRFEPKNTLLAEGAIDHFFSSVGWGNGGGIAFIEEPVFSRNHRSVIVQSYVIGSIMQSLLWREYQVSMVSNTEWKQKIVGKGNASKPEVRAFMERVYALPDFVLADPDLTDAAAILQYGIGIADVTRRVENEYRDV